MRDSVAFDRAADYYDRTRSHSTATQRAIIDRLLTELRGRGPCLEIGVGTGRIALDLFRSGVPMAGIDLSRAMLARLVEKAGGRAPFPLAVADATELPFAAGSFDAAVICHVLHLVPSWRQALAELARVVRPGGVILFERGELRDGDERSELSACFWAATPIGTRPLPGTRSIAEIDAAMADLGFAARDLEPVVERRDLSLEAVIDRLESGMLSGCWDLAEDDRRTAAAATRAWARKRFGLLDAPLTRDHPIHWRAYEAALRLPPPE